MAAEATQKGPTAGEVWEPDDEIDLRKCIDIDEVLKSYRRVASTYLEAQADAQIDGFQREQDGQRQLLDAYMARAAELLKLAGAETVLLSSEPDAPMAESIAALEAQLQLLQSQLEAENAANQQFVQQRNLAWDSLSALSTKQAELRLERAAANSEVRLGTLAIPPGQPVETASLSVSILLAGVIGLLLAVFVAFFLEYLGRPPLFVRTPDSISQP